MGQRKDFTSININSACGVEFGIAVTEACDAGESARLWLSDIDAILSVAEGLLLHEVVQPAIEGNNAPIQIATERALSLLTTARRDLSITTSVIAELLEPRGVHQAPDSAPEAEQEPPLRRAVRSLRAEQRMNEALAVVRQRVGARPTPPVPEPGPAPTVTDLTVSIWLEMLKTRRLTGLEEMMTGAHQALLRHAS